MGWGWEDITFSVAAVFCFVLFLKKYLVLFSIFCILHYVAVFEFNVIKNCMFILKKINNNKKKINCKKSLISGWNTINPFISKNFVPPPQSCQILESPTPLLIRRGSNSSITIVSALFFFFYLD